MDNIKQLQEKLKNILITDPGGFAGKIDQFNPEYAISKLSNYWNSSVKDFYNALKKIIPYDWDNTNKEGHDAGYSFSKNPYVNPNVNKNKENYYDVRGNDKMVSVLKNKQYLDYTIGNDGIEQIAADIKEYMTRLLMPQYQRRVEIEDLNRDFWVIGQNLTALNEVILRIGDEFLNLLIAELCGLWDNIYRLWQVLFYIENSIEEMASGEKIRIMMEYGYGDLEDITGKSSVVFTKENAYKYGILPYISKKKIGNTYTAFVQYNKRLWNLPQDNIDLLNEYTGNSSLIKLEKKTNRKLLEVFNYIKSKNFVLFAKGDKDCFSSIVSAEDPILTVLDFYRDYLVNYNDADNNNDLYTIISSLPVWKQAGYFKHIDFSEKDSSSIDSDENATEEYEKVKNAFRALKIMLDKHYDEYLDKEGTSFPNKWATGASTFYSCVISSSSVSNLHSKLSSSYFVTKNFSGLIKDFYYLFYSCQSLVRMPEFSLFNNSSNGGYLVPSSEEYMGNFLTKVKEYNEDNAIEIKDNNGIKKYYFTVWTGGELPIVVWDLLSMSDSIQITQSMNGFGGDYFFPYKGSSDHLWIDFVANIQTDSYNLTNANKEAGIGEKSTIGSVTINDLMNNNKKQEKDTVYDVNITAPINKRKATAADISKGLQTTYHDFVRINKPYPNVTMIESNMRTKIDSIKDTDPLGQWNDLRHLDDLNNEEKWIGYKSSGGNFYYCVDGFYAFNNDFTYSEIKNTNEMNNIIERNNLKVFSNTLTYQISTSDMISCKHETEGQSKIKNLHDFANPILNLRFINGKFDGQEIEIIITKDAVKTPKITTTTTEEKIIDPIPLPVKIEFVSLGISKNLPNDTNSDAKAEEILNNSQKDRVIVTYQTYEDQRGDPWFHKGLLIYKIYWYNKALNKIDDDYIKLYLRFWDDYTITNYGNTTDYFKEQAKKIPAGWEATPGLYGILASDGVCYIASSSEGTSGEGELTITKVNGKVTSRKATMDVDLVVNYGNDKLPDRYSFEPGEFVPHSNSPFRKHITFSLT
ncbi:MAG: hypothetical protein ACI311_04715 [Bacilli bacterium]